MNYNNKEIKKFQINVFNTSYVSVKTGFRTKKFLEYFLIFLPVLVPVPISAWIEEPKLEIFSVDRPAAFIIYHQNLDTTLFSGFIREPVFA